MAKAQDTQESTGVTERTLSALRCVAERGEFTPKDIAEEAGVPASTAYRLLQSLGAMNFVEKASQGNYRVGREFIRLAARVMEHLDYGAIAHPFLQALSERFQETVAFALYLPKDHAFTIVDTIQAAHPLQYVVTKYTLRPMVWGALGRSMLAFLPDEDVHAAIERQGQPPEPGAPPVTFEMLQGEFESIRRQGGYVGLSPNALGTNGTGAPVFNSRGQLLGALGIAVPLVRYDASLQPEMTAAVISAARDLSAALGFVDRGRRDNSVSTRTG